MGVIIAICIISAWFIHLIFMLLYQPVSWLDPWLWTHMAIQTWLYTGLFITAHDSMHGTVSENKRLNFILGYISTWLFAGMYYPQLLKKHQLHHLYPGSDADPDYKTGNQRFFVWWFSFLKQYITFWQILYMAILFNILLIWFNEIQLILFWVIPSIAATFQLFYFGTFIPHHLPHTSDMLPHNSRTQKPNHFIAFISCYFFGYHYEHHHSPQTPWWKLYKLKDVSLNRTKLKSEKK